MCKVFPVKTNSWHLFWPRRWFITASPLCAVACSQVAASVWKLADFTGCTCGCWMKRAPQVLQHSTCLTGCVLGFFLFFFLSCCALWFALWSHAVSGRVGQEQQQRRACYGASMLCFHGYATAAWGDAELTRRSLSTPSFIPFIPFFMHISDIYIW